MPVFVAFFAEEPRWLRSTSGSSSMKCWKAALDFIHHLLCAPTTRRAPRRGRNKNRATEKLRRVGASGTNHPDARIFYAALFGTRRSDSSRSEASLFLGRRRGSASLR